MRSGSKFTEVDLSNIFFYFQLKHQIFKKKGGEQKWSKRSILNFCLGDRHDWIRLEIFYAKKFLETFLLKNVAKNTCWCFPWLFSLRIQWHFHPFYFFARANHAWLLCAQKAFWTWICILIEDYRPMIEDVIFCAPRYVRVFIFRQVISKIPPFSLRLKRILL